MSDWGCSLLVEIRINSSNVDAVLFAEFLDFVDLFLRKSHFDLSIHLKNFGPSINLINEPLSSRTDSFLSSSSYSTMIFEISNQSKMFVTSRHHTDQLMSNQTQVNASDSTRDNDYPL